MSLRRRWWVIPILLVLVGYWFLPISGRVMIMPGPEMGGLWPHMAFEGRSVDSGSLVTVHVTDVEPWPFVQLLVNGRPAEPQGEAVARAGAWTWTWSYRVPDGEGYELVFYHDCHTGCIERGRQAVGDPSPAFGMGAPTAGVPTKLGLVMPRADRDWHGRSGWAVEVTYARRAEEPYWGVDDLASRVAAHRAKGLRVLVRVEYEQRQSLPPTGDYVALAEYLAYFRRLARDDRLRDVYGYIVGSDYNTFGAATLTPDRPITPAWYARVFNGYGEDPAHTDNVVQVVRSENPTVRVIVGPLRPWSSDQGGAEEQASLQLGTALEAPWLAYMDELVAMLDASAQAKAEAGVAMVAPDGFDIQAPGRPDAPEMAGTLRADEPRIDLPRERWGGAQAGFRIYRDWMAIINAYSTTRGLPIYIVSTNTYDREADVPPAQNYPKGWLSTALAVIDGEPQIRALVWFLDEFPHSDEWDWFSLTEQSGRLVDAADEFDALLELP